MITSTGNSRVRQVIALQRKAKERKRQDVFLVEGLKMFREAPKEARQAVYLSESFWRRHRRELSPELAEGIERGELGEITSDQVFAAMADTQTPQGILCVMRQFHYDREALLGGGRRTPLVMVLEDLQDPGNLGTILRTAEGAGVTGVLMSGGTADIYNPKVIRSTMGSIYRVPFYAADDLEGQVRWLKSQGLRIWAAHLKGRRDYDGEDYTGPCAFLIGNESRGLSEETARLADGLVRIPMLGQVESLNAAVSSAVLMYEAARQRRGSDRR